MSRPRCVVIGAGRIAGGFVAPLLHAAGWETVLGCRDGDVCQAVNAQGGLLVRLVGEAPQERWIAGVSALPLDSADLARAVAGAELLATSVGSSALASAGRALGPLLGARFASRGDPVNLITFENHRSAPELLATGLLQAQPSLAVQIGRQLGISGAAVWRTVSHRRIIDGTFRVDTNAVEECFVDRVPLIAGVAPIDGSIPGLTLVRAFDDRMVEKLWLFNAGYAAAAYFGWQAGCQMMDEVFAHPHLRATTVAVAGEAQQAFQTYLAGRSGSVAIPPRATDVLLDHYADPALQDPVTRVAREPRRKLAAGDRLIGPATACLAAGLKPVALATATAAALAYGEIADPGAVNLQREIELLGPREVLATISTLDPRDEFVHLVCDRYQELISSKEGEGVNAIS